ncbi:GNAT family N-acetyltransferase [Faecalimicrobium sp. JNUCC 81]
MKKFSDIELLKVCEERLVNEFHKEEIKPYELVKRLIKEEKYMGYGLYEGDKLVAYALLCKSENSEYIMLDYYVVESEFRGTGYGSKFLNELYEITKSYKGIICEIEDPDYAIDKDDLEYRKKRIKFYEKNGLHHTNVRSSVFGVKYIIMIMTQDKFVEKQVEESLRSIYKGLFGAKVLEKQIDISIV